jgi:hypothetical protein
MTFERLFSEYSLCPLTLALPLGGGRCEKIEKSGGESEKNS